MKKPVPLNKISRLFILTLICLVTAISCVDSFKTNKRIPTIPIDNDNQQSPKDLPHQDSNTDTTAAKFKCVDRQNDEQYSQSPIVILVSIDGFRADYLQKYKPTTLSQLAKAGLYTEGMRPSFPTHTFPNHYSLVTGLAPGNHGIVSNKFYDKKRGQFYNFMDPKTAGDRTWYKGEPIWNTVERQGMISMTYHWVGSDANINKKDPTCFIGYDPDISTIDKVNKTIEWLNLPTNKRPHLITIYTSIVDSAGHKYGPDSKEVADAIYEVDAALAQLNTFIQSSSLPINLIIVSDHGMEKIDNTKIIYLSDYIDLTGFKMSDRGAVTMLYHDNAETIEKAYLVLKKHENHYKVYRRNETPAEFQLNDQDRIGDLVVIADIPYFILDKSFTATPLALNSATHGWSFHNPSMKALFIAHGPQLKKKQLISEFQNIDVYPFILKILGLQIDQPIDGQAASLENYIVRPTNK